MFVLRTSRLVVYGKRAKKEAKIISYFFMISKWHPWFFIIKTNGCICVPSGMGNLWSILVSP